MNKFFFETSIKKIKEASENNKLVIFVGAGVSANSGVPTWGELVKAMAKDLGEFNMNNSQDLYMKIPQYYFNERGQKEYFEKLNEIFIEKNYKINPLHREILKLKPTHFITTNYDTLLEEAAIEAGSFYHTVKQDSDLPYNNLNKTIIKMHGDFANKNIVLKEDDYLNYSSNFTLIENYIKSLIATHTVVFIGYSVNDANFNLIFQWVKSILKSHFQPAYLLDTSNAYSSMELAYYKNRGINILQYEALGTVIENEKFEESNWRGNRLFDTLKYFNTFNIINSVNKIDYIYSKLNYFDQLNFIMPSQIIKSLELESVGYDLYGNKTLDVLRTENLLTKVFSDVAENSSNTGLAKIINIFNKANIRGISQGQKIIWKSETENDYLNTLTKEIIERDSMLEQNSIDISTENVKDDDYLFMLKRANAYYDKERFLEAYNYYKTISLKSFNDKEYLIYYLSEFNRKHVGELMIKISFNKFDKDLVTEIHELNLEDIHSRLPSKDRKNLEFVKELQDFTLIYKVQNNLRKEVEELKKAKRTIENGGISFNSSLYKQFNIIVNIWLFIKANYLSIEKYLEVQNLYLNFIEGVFASYSTRAESNSNSIFSDVRVHKIEEFDLFEIYIILTKLKSKDLENLFIEYDIKEIKIKEEGFKYLNDVLEKIINNLESGVNKSESKKFLFNLLLFASNININNQQVDTIAEKLLAILNEKTFVNDLKYLNRFIVSVSNRKLISQELIYKYLVTYLQLYEQNKKIGEYDTNNFYRNLAIIYNNYNNQKKSPLDSNLASKYLGLMHQLHKEGKYAELHNILIELILPIINIISEDQKNNVLIIIENLVCEMEEKKEKISGNESILYHHALAAQVITPRVTINNKIIEYTISILENRNNAVKTYPDPLERNLNIITDLYRTGNLQKNEIEVYISNFAGYSQYFDLIFMNPQIDLKDIELINLLKETEVESLMRDSIMAEKVYSLFEESIFNIKSKKGKEIFNKLYMKKFDS